MKILLFTLGFVLTISCFAKDVEVKGTTLVFQASDKKATCSASNDTYTFRFKEGRSFTLSPAPGVKPETMDDIIKQAAKEIKEEIKKKKIANMKVKAYNVHTTVLGIFSGKEAAITTVRPDPNSNVEYVSCTYIILLWDGKACWKGTYSGAEKGEMGIVHNILRSGKRIK